MLGCDMVSKVFLADVANRCVLLVVWRCKYKMWETRVVSRSFGSPCSRICCVFDDLQTLQQVVSKSWFNLVKDGLNIRCGRLTLARDIQVWEYVCQAQIWVISHSKCTKCWMYKRDKPYTKHLKILSEI